jgi:hypothetical protein
MKHDLPPYQLACCEQLDEHPFELELKAGKLWQTHLELYT